MSKTKNDHLVMVYGTLKRGNSNVGVIDQPGCKYLNEAITVDKYLLFGKTDGFPRLFDPAMFGDNCIVANVHNFLARVKGEVWRVDDAGLMACDHLEGHPRHYKREQVRATYEGGECLVWIYFIQNFPAWSDLCDVDDNGVAEWRPKHTSRRFRRYDRMKESSPVRDAVLAAVADDDVTNEHL